MERKIINELSKWRIDTYKKPLLLYGVSGCGKTYSVLEFGKEEYKNVIYFDCSNNLELNYVFDKNTTIDKLIRGLSALSLETIFKEESLIILDNISDKIFNAVKKLFVGQIDYHFIMVTNSQEMLKKAKADEVNLKKMWLVNFSEYLKYLGKDQMVDFIEDSFKTDKQMPFHTLAMELFNDYVLTGGYPDAIVSFNDDKDYNLLSTIHERNIKLIKNKLFNIDNLIDIKRCNEIYEGMAMQLLKENKKFQYGLLKKGSRAKDYESALNFMDQNNLVVKSCRVKELTSPLSKIKEEESFKLYFNDAGLLYKKMNVGANRLLTNDKLLEVLYENSIVVALSQNGFNIYHYHSDGKAELDIVIQTRTGKIVPIEILNSSYSTKSKSLSLALNKYNLTNAIRFTDDNFKNKKGVKYIPYYAAFCITEGM